MDVRETKLSNDPSTASTDAHSWRGAGLVTGFLIGAVVGAGIALLLAPENGRQTRRRLRRRMQAIRKTVARGLEETEAHARHELERGRRGLRERMRS